MKNISLYLTVYILSNIILYIVRSPKYYSLILKFKSL